VRTTLSELKKRSFGSWRDTSILIRCGLHMSHAKSCVRHRFKSWAPLPLNRLKKAEAFNVTGVDFAGPLYYKPVASKKARRQKASSEPSTEEEALTEEDDDTTITVYHCKCYVCLFTRCNPCRPLRISSGFIRSIIVTCIS
jgi:hypothetical protein